MPGSHRMVRWRDRVFPRRRLVYRLPDPRRDASHHEPHQPNSVVSDQYCNWPKGILLIYHLKSTISWTPVPTRPGRQPGSHPAPPASGVFRDPYSVMNAWGANHGAFSYGHIGADLITLASMLRIPVFMHNVPDEKYLPPQYLECFWHRGPGRR